jgi:uncharacterized membrane protein
VQVAGLLFVFASCAYGLALALRHAWFQTSAWDLAIFDQAVALIAQGLPPDSSLLGYHILGDHGAFVLYPLGWLARLIPSPWLLFALQSLALASSVFPLAALAEQRGLTRRATAASLLMLLLYPVVFNTAIFDFHPETLAFPLIMQALWWLERRAKGDESRVLVVLLLALTCKAGLALLVFAIGAVLLVRGRLRIGANLMLLSSVWLAVVTRLVLPFFGGDQAGIQRHAEKFALAQVQPSSSVFDWLELARPLLSQIFSLASLEYLLLLLLPVGYVLLYAHRRRFFLALLPFLPLLILNLAAARPAMKDLVHHYSLFLVPFLAMAVQQTLIPGVAGLGAYPGWLPVKVPNLVIAWSLLFFVLLSRLSFFFTAFPLHLDHLPAMREAVTLVKPDSALLVSNAFAAHLSHRQRLSILSPRALSRLDEFEEVLIDRRHPGFRVSTDLLNRLLRRLATRPVFRLVYARDDVLLFRRLPGAAPRDP